MTLKGKICIYHTMQILKMAHSAKKYISSYLGGPFFYNIERYMYLDFSLIYVSSVYFSFHTWHYVCLHLLPSLPPTPISRCKHPDRNLCNVVLTFTHSFLLANLASFNYHKLSIIQSWYEHQTPNIWIRLKSNLFTSGIQVNKSA